MLGKEGAPADKHPPIKRVPGGSTSGVALVSFNDRAFESYGWRRNENATVSREAAEACATALNRLLDRNPKDGNGEALPQRHIRIGADTAVCYWGTAGRQQQFIDCFSPLLEANPEQVRELYRSIWRGVSPCIEDKTAILCPVTQRRPGAGNRSGLV